MAHFHRVPGEQPISNQTLTIGRDIIKVGLWGYLDHSNNELDVTCDNPRVRVSKESLTGNSRHWIIKGSDGDLAKVQATTNGVVWDSFRVRFTRTIDPGSEVTIRPITKDVFGRAGDDHLTTATTSDIKVIDVATFRTGDRSNTPRFRISTPKTVRMGVFAARNDNKNGSDERAVILMLPETGRPDRVLFVITHQFSQNKGFYSGLGWTNPLSIPLIQLCANRFVLQRWGAQMLATRKQMALVLIVRASGIELGPFAGDGKFTARVLESIAQQTNLAFSYNAVETFTFSSGIEDFNGFLGSISGDLNVAAIYNADPKGAKAAISVKGAVKRQFLTGMTGHGGPVPGFEFMPASRWVNDPMYVHLPVMGDFDYLHNHCMANYALPLAIEM